jgi:hypothetical protein
MTSEPIAPAEPPGTERKPRRFWLLAPYVAVIVLLVGYCAAWFIVKNQIETRLDGAASGLRARGYDLELTDRRIGGFPFRMRVSFGRLKLGSTSGWAVEAQGPVAQAYLHDLTHWVLVLPQGLTVDRPNAGPLTITGQAIRASVSGVTRSPWRIAIQGVGLSFTPGPSGKPFYLDAADRFEAYLRPTADGVGDGEYLLRLEGAKPHPHTVAWNLSPEAPVRATVQGRIFRLASATGPNWHSAVRAWATAGGQVSFTQGSAQGGATAIAVLPSTVWVDSQGRLEGDIVLRLNQSPPVLETENGVQPVPPQPPAEGGVPFNFDFHNGLTRLGPVPLGPAPKIYGEPASVDPEAR